MTELPGKAYGPVNAWPDPVTPGRWRYLPHAPTPQRSEGGKAQVTAIEAGDMLMLTIGTSLSISEAEHAAAVARIAAETGAKPADVDLRPADATVSGAVLTLTVDGAEPIELATAQPSPLAPFPAAFSAMLQGDRAKQANAALKSGKGRLGVRYDVALAGARSATAELSGDPSGIDDIEGAIGSGKLKLLLSGDADASETLKADVRRRVIEEASSQLARRGTPDAPESAPSDYGAAVTTATATLAAHATRTESVPVKLKLEANVADWMK